MDPGHAYPAKGCPMRRPTAARYPGSAARCASAARPHGKRQRGLQPAVWLAMALWTAAAAPLHAQEVRTKTGQGYSVTVELPWQSSVTYQPLWITITPVVAPTAPRRMTIEVVGYRHRSGSVVLRTERSLDIAPEEGTTPRTTTVLVPLVLRDAPLRVRFREGDRVLHALDVEVDLSDTGWPGSNVFVNVFVTDWHQRAVAERIPDAMGTGNVPRFNLPTVVPPTRLPEQWIELSGVDTIWIALDDLRALAQDGGPRLRALRSWTAAGGVLIVYGLRPSAAAGSQAAAPHEDDLRQIEQLLELDPPGQVADGTLQRWQLRPITVGQYQDSVVPEYYDPERSIPNGATPPMEPPPEDDAARLATLYARHLELGTVAAVVDSPWKLLTQPPSVFAASDVEQRYGGTPPWMPDFDEFLVPGVGRPPVVMFHILITLFVIGIGPVNYLLLRRKKKLYLMLVTVPAIALGATAGLLGYAMLSDGFQVRVRAHTYTAIDQTQATPRAVSFARLSYYAGLAPGGGLRFPTDTVVLSFVSSQTMDRVPGERRLVWDRDQHLASGWIVSRSPMQLVTARSRQTQARLRIEPAAEEGAPPRVTNELGTHVHYLVLCDAQGKQFAGEQLAPGGTTTLRADNVPSVRTAMLQSIAQASQVVDAPWARSGRYAPYEYGPYSEEPLGSGRKPLLIASSTRPCLLRGLDAALEQIDQPTKMRPRSYVAIVEKSPEVDFGVADVQQVSSLHVIVGRW